MSEPVIGGQEIDWSAAKRFTSNGALVKHRECAQKWLYSTVRKFERLDYSEQVELGFGQWWHALRAASSIDRGRALGSLQYAPERLTTTDDGPAIDTVADGLVVSRVVLAAEQWWEKGIDEEQREIWTERLGEPMPQRLVNLFNRWSEHWSEELQQEKPLAVEMQWWRRLPRMTQPDGEKIDPNTALLGYVDEVYFDTKTSMVVVRDHKLHRRLDDKSHEADLFNGQLQMYAFGIAPIVKGWGYGQVRAVSFDRAKMVAPKPPSLTKSGRLAQRGGEPSISSSDLHTYLEWAKGPDGDGVPYPGMKKDGSDAGRYVAEESVIERLSTPQARAAWFSRATQPISRNVITAHLTAAVDSAIDSERTRARAEITGAAARNFTKACQWCDFAKLCRAEIVGGPAATEDLELAEYGLKVKRKHPRS